MKRKYIEKNNILLVNITRLGDMLQSTPTIAGMKMENPNCKITVLVEKQFAGICKLLPHIDETIPLDLGMTVRSLAREGDGIIDAFEYISSVVEDLKSRNFDYCLNMSNSAYTALLLRLLDIKRHGGWSSDDEGYRVIESDWAKLFASCVFHTNRHYNTLNLVDVFRSSADVEMHPNKLLMNLDQESIDYAKTLISDFKFTNTGPLIAVQAGASQGKRQWSPPRFVKFINTLIEKCNARIVLTGTQTEMSIISKIVTGCNSPNVGVAAGKTNLSQLGGLLKESDILVTGDTGPMHMSVAAGTPVVSMFLASALGFETGPYSEGNIVLQPVIACGPCNPNKPCARPDCHDLIDPEYLAELTMLRLKGDIKKLPPELAHPKSLAVFRTYFDEAGFYDMEPLNLEAEDQKIVHYRNAYRKLWLDDLAGITLEDKRAEDRIDTPVRVKSSLALLDPTIQGIQDVLSQAEAGRQEITKLVEIIRDTKSPPHYLKDVSTNLNRIDKAIESLGYHYPELGLLTRMFIFAKENISGSEAMQLASQMEAVYSDLSRRGMKLSQYYQMVN